MRHYSCEQHLLSPGGDEIHLVYVTFFTEDQESEHVARKKEETSVQPACKVIIRGYAERSTAGEDHA